MSIVSPLIFAGDAALVDLMERAESEIDEALDAADGFHNLVGIGDKSYQTMCPLSAEGKNPYSGP
jgi:hypothetical protein